MPQKKEGQSLADYLEEQLALKKAKAAAAAAAAAGTGAEAGPMSAMRRAPVKPGEAQDHRPTLAEVRAADKARENFKQMKWKEKQGLTRYGVTGGRNTKKKGRRANLQSGGRKG